MKKQWGFILAVLMAMVTMAMGGCGGGGDSSGGTGGTTSYSVSGAVTVNGSGLAGVTVALSGSSSATTTTDSSGNYSFGSIQNGSYAVTPALAGYTFTPAPLAVTVSGANQTGKSFTATTTAAGTYSVSGTITSGGTGLAGVTVTLSGSGSTTATTDSSGNYTFSGAQNGSYAITPTLTGYTFAPAALAFTVSSADLIGKDFTASVIPAATYSISGTISGTLAGVTVSTSGGSATSDVSGNYTISGLANGNYTLTPSKSGYTFTQATLSATINSANVNGKNFTATVITGLTTGTIQLPKTGQTVSYATGDDGDLEKGVAWPTPRFTDNSNGTVTDNLTGLIWLRNANCFGTKTWSDALIAANTLSNGACGLTDVSIAGEWRLPNINELESLIDISVRNTAPTALTAGHPFTSVQDSGGYLQQVTYWSSTSYAYNNQVAWGIGMPVGYVGTGVKGSGGFYYVWPVRAGQ